MERKEAIALLKEIVGNSLCLPSLVYLKENKRGKFVLVFKGDCDTVALKQFAAEKNLTIREETEKACWLITKP